MSRILKYVIPENPPSPILFAECYTHSEMARNLGKIMSAGFCRIDLNGNNKFVAHVWGESVSLKLKADENDVFFIERMFNEPY